jgi:primosomal protein N' (replication factor Y)
VTTPSEASEASPTRADAAYAEVIVPLPLEGRFHYAVPEALQGGLQIGHRVLVPFGPRKLTGFVVALSSQAPDGIVPKPILERLDEDPLLSAELLELVRFASEYYLAPAGEILKIALPPGITAGSTARWKLTKAGRAALAAVSGGSSSLDEADLAMLTRLGGKGTHKRADVPRAAAERLVALGLVEAVDSISAKSAADLIEVAERTSIPVVLAALGRAHTQRTILERLADGPLPVEVLAEELGRATVRRTLNILVADGWVKLSLAKRSSGPLDTTVAASPFVATQAQLDALAALAAAATTGTAQTFLLRGVTGSGKTEVYLRAIEEARARGRGAIVLVPEIALTTQLEDRFRARFSDDVVVLHSAMTDVERRRGWERLRAGEAHIALGPRSAVWAPVASLGIVVVDEEHDASFKQHSDVRYHGRDLAIYRAHKTGAVVVLGSATPSLETRYGVETGRMTELRLPARATGGSMPTIEIVDLGKVPKKGEIPLLTRPLADALRSVVEKKEQAIIFLNRRGFNTVVVCGACQAPRTCHRCAVSLTHHKGERVLVCHYCGHREAFDAACKSCGGTEMKPFGAGTERVAEAVQEVVPDARVLRLDRDVTAKVGALDETLEAFRELRADVLVGTQMVTKGHDFPRVTLVGIICADTSLAFPDFRAAERTFQLVTQVAGRAGRAELPGRVVVQTFQPEHYALLSALAHDDEAFFRQELELRREVGYPPLTRLGMIRVEGTAEAQVAEAARELGELTQALARAQDAEVRGPVPAPIAKIKDRFRWMTMVRAASPSKLLTILRGVRARVGRLPRGVAVVFDVDAVDML